MGSCSSQKLKPEKSQLYNQYSQESLQIPILGKQQLTNTEQNEMDQEIKIQLNQPNKQKGQGVKHQPIKYSEGITIKKGIFTRFYSIVIQKNDTTLKNSNGIIVQHNITGLFRVAKCYSKSNKLNRTLVTELSLNSHVHSNLLNILEIYEDDKQYTIIWEKLEGPLLSIYLQNIKITEKLLACILQQICQAIQYLHSKSIIHGRININSFQLQENSNHPYIKLIDYEKFINKPEIDLEQYHYQAPELLNTPVQCSIMGDIWACGIIAYFIISKQSPYSKTQRFCQLKHEIQKGGINYEGFEFDKLSQKCKGFIKLMLESNFEKRASFNKLLADDWLHDNQLIEKKKIKSALDYLFVQKSLTRLQSKFLIHMVDAYLPIQKQLLYEIYNEIDSNKDGKLNIREIKTAFYLVFGNQINNSQISELVKKLDLDNNGIIDFDEFLSGIIDRKLIITKQNLEGIFSLIDQNSNGKLGLNEMSQLFKLDPEIIKNELINRKDVSCKQVYIIYKLALYNERKPRIVNVRLIELN